VPARILRVDGQVEEMQAIAAVETQFDVDVLRAGGVIPTILRRTLAHAA
jgi:aconitate hydratase